MILVGYCKEPPVHAENPRVGSSILSLGTSKIKALHFQVQGLLLYSVPQLEVVCRSDPG
jgi:hypothetical protein